MRIQRIEIIGFKSFCDRTVLTFNHPVTAVVGPNGCGKSNIVDAIRWCMGEQSAKHLRGGSMADVIFNGSETRPAAGVAEVSLTFEDVAFSPQILELDNDGLSAENNTENSASSESTTPAHEHAVHCELVVSPQGQRSVTSELAKTPSPPGARSHDAASYHLIADGATATKVAQAAVDKVLVDAPLTIDFAQYNEVTITRRLFRDGTSNYFLNKVPCRLRDVTEFFLGTGVGTKAYSIIEQGRIGMIVSARAQDRRALIEEAAGITKFKTKKRLAERKLAQTRQNLVRVYDIVEELKKRLDSLSRQAQKAERYRRYKTELRDIELWIASQRYCELSVQSGVLASQLSLQVKQRDEARAQLETQDADMIVERAELAEVERGLSALQEALYELDNRVKLGESKIQYQNREVAELKQRIVEAQADISVLVGRRDKVSAELADTRRQRDAVKSEYVDEEQGLCRHKEALEQVRCQLSEAQEHLDRVRAVAAQARTDMVRAQSQRQAVARRSEDTAMRLARLDQECQAMQVRCEELDKDVRSGERVLAQARQTKLALGDQAQILEAQHAATANETEQAEALVETLRTELHKRKSRLQSLVEIQEKYEGFTCGTRAVMQRRDWMSPDARRICGLVADVVQAPAHLETAVEAALGDQLGGVLVQDHNVGIEAVRFLKEEGAGRTALVCTAQATPVIAVEDRTGAPQGAGVVGAMVDMVRCDVAYEPMAQRLLHDYWVVESLEAAVTFHRQGCTQTLVTLDGDIVDGRGVVTGGSRDAEGAGVLAQKREIRNLGEIVDELERDLAAAIVAYVANKAEVQRLTRALDVARKEQHRQDIDILGREKDVARCREERDRLVERIVRLDAERAELTERVTQMLREMQATDEQLQSAHECNDRHEVQESGLVSAVSEARATMDELAQVLTDHKVRVAQLDEKASALSTAVIRFEQMAKDISERTQTQESFMQEAMEKVTTLGVQSEELATSLIASREQRQSKLDGLEQGRSGYDERIARLQLAESTVRTLRMRTDELSSEVTQCELDRHDLDNELSHLCQAMAERYHVVLPREIGNFHLRPLVGVEQTQRLAELKRLIDRMGTDINLTAIEEFEEISTRHGFLQTQKTDLEAACDKLEKAINKMNATSRRLFKETFRRINELFQETFPRLFRGGKAYLSLTGEDGGDVLDAGVEIMARPPGKKNATVDQLSGGEKALTAVALIFSIFVFKPSPFCLLDEVDAPLDDANVDRYNEFVRQMTECSQFIVITHNKRTMEIADHLYGITMQDPGSSKVVDVDLKQVDDYAA